MTVQLEGVVSSKKKDQKSPHGEDGWDPSSESLARFSKTVKVGNSDRASAVKVWGG